MSNWLSEFNITEAPNPLDDTLGFGEHEGKTIRTLIAEGRLSYLKWMCKTDVVCAMRYYKPVVVYLASNATQNTLNEPVNEINW